MSVIKVFSSSLMLLQKARVFVPNSCLYVGLMSEGKVMSLTRQILDQVEKNSGKNTLVFAAASLMMEKKFYNVDSKRLMDFRLKT